MTGAAWLVVRKDARQHAAVLAAWASLVVLRGLLVGTGLDSHFDAQVLVGSRAANPLQIAYWAVSLLQTALMVAIAAQVVQADSLVGTTAFWLTRPIPRWRLAAAKFLTLALILLALPMLVEAMVLAANGAGAADVARAIAETAVERTMLLLPLVALAAVTANLASFVVAGIATATGLVLVQFVLDGLLRLSARGRTAGALDTAQFVAVVVALAICLAALLHQFRTRRTARSAAVLAAGGVICLLLLNRWTADWTSPKPLEAGLFDPGRVVVTLGPAASDGILRPDLQRFVGLRATLATPPPRPGIVLAPLAVSGVTCGPDRRPVSGGGRMFSTGYAVIQGPPMVRPEVVGPLLGGIDILSGMKPARNDANPFAIATLPAAAWDAAQRDGLRCSGDLTLGAVEYARGADLPLGTGLAAPDGDPGLSVVSSACDPDGCSVVVRDVAAVFSFTGARSSHVEFWLVDPVRKAALVGQQEGVRAFGRANLPVMTEHLGVTYRLLRFAVPKGTPAFVASDWLRDGRLVAVHVRDAGQFTRPFVVEDVRSLVAQ